jgi:hypothetical protein
MVLAAPGPLLTPAPSSFPPKTPPRSYSAQIRSQNEENESFNSKRPKTGNPQAATTWAAEFLLRAGESREFFGSWINSGAIHEAKKRRATQVITCSFPCGKWLHMIGAVKQECDISVGHLGRSVTSVSVIVSQECDISVGHLCKWALRVVERCVLSAAPG